MKKHLLLFIFFLSCSVISFGQYCAGGPTSTADSNIEAVTSNGVSTSIMYTGCPGVTGVEDQTAMAIDVMAGGSYTMDVTFGTCGSNYAGAGEAWIDYDNNFTFDAGESIGSSTGTPGTAPWDAAVTFSFTVPATACNGPLRIRVMQRESGTNPLDPCASYTWGSVIEFTANVSGGMSCSTPPPDCNSTLTSDLTAFAIDGDLTWTAATGGPTGYKISVGTTMGGTDIANNVDVMASTTYTPAGLAYSTTYYTTITPYNAIGDATGCMEQSFVTEPVPPTGSLCSDPIVVPAALPYNTTDNTSGYGDDYENADNPCGGLYTGGDEVVYSYTPTVDVNVDITLTGTGTWTGVFVLEGCPFTTCVDQNTDSGGNPAITNLDLIGGTEYFIVISTFPAPQSTAYTLDITENSCSNPTATYVVVDDCAVSGGFLIDVVVTDLGTATSLSISDDQGTNPMPITATGTYQIGPYVNATDVIITVTNDQDGTCFITSTALTQAVCPPDCAAAPMITCGTTYSTGDLSGTGAWNPDNATAGTCFSTPGAEAVWQFMPTASGMYTINIDLSSGTTSWNDFFWRGDQTCEEANWVCINDVGGTSETHSFGPLTAGVTYYILVDSETTGAGRIHDFVIDCLLENDGCADASVLATNVPGSLLNETLVGATASGLGAESCDAGSTPTPNDVWYTINTDGDGGVLTVTVVPGANSDVVVGIYSGCGGAADFVICGDGGANGAPETVTVNMANIKDKKGGSSTRNADYLVRVYEKVPSGEDFSIAASGSALPIMLGSFEANAEKRGNMIEWTTLSEINSDYVEVQSSPNGSTKWETVGKVGTKGESLSRLDYELFDNNPYSITYYRLNAIDKDGKSEMSHSINVRRDDRVGKMSLSPNPTNSIISLQTVSEADMIGTITIHDMTGKIIQNESINLKNGLNTVSIDLDDLNTGIYLFSLRTEDGVQVEKIVKQ